MIARDAEKYCCEKLSQIENYVDAISDKKVVWHCHHKLELCDGQEISKERLKKHGLYYNRPAEELIFLHPTAHHLLHWKKTRRFDFSKVVNFNDFIQEKQKIQKKYAFWNEHNPQNRIINNEKMKIELKELFQAYERNEQGYFDKESKAKEYCRITKKLITHIKIGGSDVF